MQITGMLYGSKLLEHVDFPASEVLGPGASEDEIQALIDRSAMLNLATRAFVDDDIKIDVIARDLAEARQGKSIPAADVYRRLGIAK